MWQASRCGRWLLAVVLCGGATDAADPLFQRKRNMVYADVHGVGLLVDVFIPTMRSNGRGIVDVVSGAWHSDPGKLRDHERAQIFEIFCRQGYTVFALRPGSVPKFTALEMAEHIRTGIRWVKGRHREFSIAAERLGLMGASAGGHLASLVAVTSGPAGGSTDASVAAVGAFFPPTDFIEYGTVTLDPVKPGPLNETLRRLAFTPGEIAGLTAAQIKQRVHSISPARLVTAQTPPFLLIHGGLDLLVPLQQSRLMVTALDRKQVPVKLIVKPGGGHPWPTIAEEVALMAQWFDRQLVASRARPDVP